MDLLQWRRGRRGDFAVFVQCRGEEEEEEEEMTEAAVAMQQVGTAAQAVVVALDWQSSPETRRNATAYLDSVRRPFVFSLGVFVGFFLRSLFVFFFPLRYLLLLCQIFFCLWLQFEIWMCFLQSTHNFFLLFCHTLRIRLLSLDS